MRCKYGSSVTLCAVLAAPVAAQRMVVVDRYSALFEIDLVSGVATGIGRLQHGIGPTGLALDPVGGTVYASSASDYLYSIDIDTHATNLIGRFGDSSIDFDGIEWDPNGQRLVAVSRYDQALFWIDPITGEASSRGTIGLPGGGNLALDTDSGIMYAVAERNGNLYEVNTRNGFVRRIGPLINAAGASAMAYNSDDGRLYMIEAATRNLCWLDTTTGEATVIGSTGVQDISGMVYIPVPTPGGVAVLGAAGLGWRRRR